MTSSLTHNGFRSARLVAAAVVTAGISLAAGMAGRGGDPAKHASRAPIGIVDTTGVDQAPILAAMAGVRRVELGGFRFWLGTIDRRPVVDVASGESDEACELATYLLDTHFHPRVALLSGVAGSENASVHVGDVVVGAYVVDKSAVRYRLGGFASGYRGEEVALTRASDIAGDVVTGFGSRLPTPRDAKTYGLGPGTANHHEVFVQAFAAPASLVAVATRESSRVGTATVAHATGEARRTGRIRSKVVAGVIGQADAWTEPLTWIEAENMLYPSDAEESEASGFAFASAEAGVPSLVVRGISQTVWYPRADDPVLGAAHAALVVRYLVEHMPARIPTIPVELGDLWPASNAARLGYLVARSAYYYVSEVPRVSYVARSGRTVVLAGRRLQALEREYTYGAGAIR